MLFSQTFLASRGWLVTYFAVWQVRQSRSNSARSSPAGSSELALVPGTLGACAAEPAWGTAVRGGATDTVGAWLGFDVSLPGLARSTSAPQQAMSRLTTSP